MIHDVVLYCDCANAGIVPASGKQRLRCALAGSSRPVRAVRDLCGLAAKGDDLLGEVAAAERAVIIACRPRAVRWLFHRAGADLIPGRARLFDMRTADPEHIIEALGPLTPAAGEIAITGPVTTDWRPWFPVIDYDRCTNCGECFEFCLFGVYARDACGRIVVHRPSSCKDNCPACARMCPSVAIMFPKLDEQSPICGGDEPPAATPGKVQLSREDLFGSEGLDRLRARQRKQVLLRPDAL